MLPPMKKQLILNVIGGHSVVTYSYRLAKDKAILDITLRQAVLVLPRPRGVKSHVSYETNARCSVVALGNKKLNTKVGSGMDLGQPYRRMGLIDRQFLWKLLIFILSHFKSSKPHKPCDSRRCSVKNSGERELQLNVQDVFCTGY